MKTTLLRMKTIVLIKSNIKGLKDMFDIFVLTDVLSSDASIPAHPRCACSGRQLTDQLLQ